MLTLDLGEFSFELKEGAVKHVGASNQSATAKLYDVGGVTVREFGDDRVKLGFEDEEGNEIEVALPGREVAELAEELEQLRAENGSVD